MKFTPLSPDFGIEAAGIDLSRPLPEADFEILRHRFFYVPVGLAIIVTIFRTRRSASVDEPSLLRY